MRKREELWGREWFFRKLNSKNGAFRPETAKASSPQNDSNFPNKTVFNAKANSAFEKLYNFVVFFRKLLFVAQFKFTTKAAIFSRVQTLHTRIFIFILQPTSIGSHVGKKLWSKLIHTLRLIHTLTWRNFDYHWFWVWFDSCEIRRLTQSRPSGVLDGWPGVKNASAAPDKISRTYIINWVKRRTSHEPN